MSNPSARPVSPVAPTRLADRMTVRCDLRSGQPGLTPPLSPHSAVDRLDPDRSKSKTQTTRRTPEMATQETARQEAADTLRPHATDPAIADIIASLTGEDQGEDDALEKAMTKISVAREALVKDANVS